MKKEILFFFCLFSLVRLNAQICYSTKHMIGADTLVYLNKADGCTMSIGFWLDDDEVDFCYNIQNDSIARIKNCELVLYDRWGTKVLETKEKKLNWAKGYDDDPTHGATEFAYVFTYTDKDGGKKMIRGFVKDIWW